MTDRAKRREPASADERRRARGGQSGIPEFETRDTETSETLRETGKGIARAFTIERDTSLADGAGAPGSTDVGGLQKDDEPEGGR